MEQDIEKELVLVEALSQYRMRYIVEVPKGREDWAVDTVCFEEAKESGQKYLGETILSSRVVTKEEALKLIVEDSPYVSTWSEENLMEVFLTII